MTATLPDPRSRARRVGSWAASPAVGVRHDGAGATPPAFRAPRPSPRRQFEPARLGASADGAARCDAGGLHGVVPGDGSPRAQLFRPPRGGARRRRQAERALGPRDPVLPTDARTAGVARHRGLSGHRATRCCSRRVRRRLADDAAPQLAGLLRTPAVAASHRYYLEPTERWMPAAMALADMPVRTLVRRPRPAQRTSPNCGTSARRTGVLPAPLTAGRHAAVVRRARGQLAHPRTPGSLRAGEARRSQPVPALRRPARAAGRRLARACAPG
jgi:hypothetical protein